MGQINRKITIRPIYFGMLLLSVAMMILSVRLTVASELDSLKAAAEQGDTRAQEGLGSIYEAGLGIPKDYIQAYAWSNIAAAQGSRKAKELLEGITKEMTTADITRAQELSLEYWEAYGPSLATSE